MAWVSVGFFHAFVAAFSVIIVSEIGDKTFFIAAIMAMRHSRSAISQLPVMISQSSLEIEFSQGFVLILLHLMLGAVQ